MFVFLWTGAMLNILLISQCQGFKTPISRRSYDGITNSKGNTFFPSLRSFNRGRKYSTSRSVENLQLNQKMPSPRSFISRGASIFTPAIVIIISAMVSILQKLVTRLSAFTEMLISASSKNIDSAGVKTEINRVTKLTKCLTVSAEVASESDRAPVVTVRAAVAEDVDLILGFIKELARFEEMESSVVATTSILRNSLFPAAPQKPSNAEVIILEINGVPSGFALYFYNFSTFLGKPGLYIEDIYVRQEFRGKGYGKMLFKNICKTARSKDCGRVEWWCLDWNEQAIKFYVSSLRAEAMKDWTVYRLSEDRIRDIAGSALF